MAQNSAHGRLIIVCAILSAALGHNITLVMMFPLVVSTRYFDEKYTRNVAILTAVIFAVAGKGVGAALFMTISKTVLKNQLQLGISPAEALNNANRQLCENNDAGLFVTCWAGVFDTESGVLTFVNAGHNPPVLLKNGEKAEFIKQRSGFVLAGLDGYKYKQEELQLSPGDEMFFYTDGVTEATDAGNQLYGDSRLLECLNKCREQDVTEQLNTLKADIDAFVDAASQFDDITIMAMKIS